MIAADVNNSKSITTLDLIALRKLILNIDQNFANNTSWRFVDAAYRFPDSNNPWSTGFPEVVSVNNLASNISASFVAIKIQLNKLTSKIAKITCYNFLAKNHKFA
jgi:hypothetical protein